MFATYSRPLRRSNTARAFALPVIAGLLIPTSCSSAAPQRPSRPATSRLDQERASDDRLADADGQLVRYQTALDLVAKSQFTEARVVLEDTVRRFGDAPEINLLLAYVLEREGRATQARGVLKRVAARSPLAASYLQRLGTAPGTSTATATRSTRRTSATNPARSPVADQRLARMEKLMLDLVNAARRQNGLDALEWSDDLAEVARAHSVEMRELDYFAHESPTAGLNAPFDRYVAGMNRTPHIVAENIYRYWGSRHTISDADVRSGHTALMNSPGHRANILHRDVTRIGIGVAANANGDIWITQMFDRP